MRPLKRRLEPRKQWILAREYVAELGYGDCLCPVLAQEARKRMDFVRRTMQRQHAGGGRSAEGRLHAEFLPCAFDHRCIAGGDARAHLAEGTRARLRGHPVEDDARGLALVCTPLGAARGDEVRLRT